jgi:hypothetical protein
MAVAVGLAAPARAAMLGQPGIPGRSDQFVRGTDGMLYWRFTEGENSRAAAQHSYVYEGNRGVPLVSDPAAASWGTTRADVFVINQNQTIDHGGIDPSTDTFGWWDNWGTPAPGHPLKGLAASSGRYGLVDVFAVDVSPGVGYSTVYHRRWDNGWDTGWVPFGGTGGPAVISGAPAVVSGANSADRLDVFVTGLDFTSGHYKIYHAFTESGYGGSNWETLGEPYYAAAASAPAVASTQPGRIDLVITNAYGWVERLQTTNLSNWYWTYPISFTQVTGKPALVAMGPDELRAFAHQTSDGSLVQTRIVGTSTSTDNFGGVLLGGPAASSWGLSKTIQNVQYPACATGLTAHNGVCVHPNWADPSVYDQASANLGYGPGGGGGEWGVRWTSRLNGIAHDSANWYFNTDTNVYLVPLNDPITQNFGDWLYNWPSLSPNEIYFGGGWNQTGAGISGFHMGDPDFYKGHLFMPIELHTDVSWGQFVAVLNPAPDYTYHLSVAAPPQLMPLQMHFAWLAMNPEDGTMFTATTFSNVGSLQTYKLGADLQFTPDRVIPLKWPDGSPLVLPDQVQGGAFSPNGYLYINCGQPGWEGLYAFDTDGTLHGVVYGQKHRSLYFPIAYDGSEEVEGVDILDMSPYPGSGMKGQIHMELLNLYPFPSPKHDALIYYHWNINSPLY